MKNIIVISHPRSGTHLLIDFLRNNFVDYSSWYLTTGGFKRRQSSIYATQSLLNRFSRKPRVVKTHLDNSSYFGLITDCLLAKVYLSGAIMLYIYRDGMDVLASQYLRDVAFMKEKLSLFEYLKQDININGQSFSRPSYWKHHVSGWLSQDNVYSIRYEDLILDPKNVLNKLEETFSFDRNEDFVDVRLEENIEKFERFNESNQLDDGISRTSIWFRKGGIGDGQRLFSSQCKKYYFECVK